jgi:hypothetical protein
MSRFFLPGGHQRLHFRQELADFIVEQVHE